MFRPVRKKNVSTKYKTSKDLFDKLKITKNALLRARKAIKNSRVIYKKLVNDT